MKKYFIMVCVLVQMAAHGVENIIEFESPEQEVLYRELITELRCLVCQNQNIADSNAELAQDLRVKTQELILQGKSEQEIKVFMRERYGDFVLYAPPINQKTSFLWFAPFVFLMAALGALLFYIRRHTHTLQEHIEGEEKGEGEPK